jgi:hypothetical protein
MAAAARCACSGAQPRVGDGELLGVGTGRGHGDADAPDAEADLGADFQELQADRAAGGAGEPGVGEAEAAQRFSMLPRAQ